MRALFYKLVDPHDKHTWFKKDVEITSLGQFLAERNEIFWTSNSQRFCSLWNIKDTDDQKMVSDCKNVIESECLADAYYLVEKMYQMGVIAKELEEQRKRPFWIKMTNKLKRFFDRYIPPYYNLKAN